MCAIFGIVCLKNNTVDKETLRCLIADLFIRSQARGKDASGLAVSSLTGIKVLKDKIPASAFISRDEYKSFIEETLVTDNEDVCRTMSIIGHCRFKTKGSPENNDNNHPIVTDSMVGIHNGIISNDDLLFDRYKTNIKSGKGAIDRKAQVDSEIIFRLFEYFVKIYKNPSDTKNKYMESLKTATKLLMGNFACAAVHKNIPHVTWIFKNNNQVFAKHYEDTGIVIFSTASEFIKYSEVNRGLGDNVRPIIIGSDEAIAINARDNTFMRFDLLDKLD